MHSFIFLREEAREREVLTHGRGGAEGGEESPEQTPGQCGAQCGARSHVPEIMAGAETQSWTLT